MIQSFLTLFYFNLQILLNIIKVIKCENECIYALRHTKVSEQILIKLDSYVAYISE